MFSQSKSLLTALAISAFAVLTAWHGSVHAQAPIYKPAKMTSSTPICGRGDHFDLINGGSCWRCPQGTERTVFPVNGSKACERPAKTLFASASNRGNPTSASPLLPKTNCPKGAFLDIGLGRCYSCPRGYQRTTQAVTHQRACSRNAGADLVAASPVGKAGCPAGSFFDPIRGGSCWSCPSGSKRTTTPVNGNRACQAPGVAAAAGQGLYDDIYGAAVSSGFISNLANGGKLGQTRLSPGQSYAVSAAELTQILSGKNSNERELFGAAITGQFRGKAYYRWPLAFKRVHSKLLEGLTFAVLSDRDRVIVTFYGTNMSFTESDPGRPGNLIYDIANPPFPSPRYDGNVVFPGFAGLADVIYEELKPQLLRDFGIRGKQVIVTGHSLGGAVAGHVSYLMLRDGLLSKTDASGRRLEHRLVMLGTPRFVINPEGLGGLKSTWERNQSKAAISAVALEIKEDPTPLAFTSLGQAQLVQSFGKVHRISKNSLQDPKGANDFLRYHNGDNYIQYAKMLRDGQGR